MILNNLPLSLLLCLSFIVGTTYSANADAFSDMFGDYGGYFKTNMERRKDDDDRRRLLESREEEERDDDMTKDSSNENGNAPTTGKRNNKDSYQSKDDWIPRDDKASTFTGATFDPSTFIDTDFSRQSFMDSLKMKPPPDNNSKPLLTAHVATTNDGGGSASEKPVDESDMQKALNVDADTWKELMTPIRSLFGDWVPSPPDPTAMGSFGLSQGNGRPVPYRLNGHVDMERGVPWEPGH